MYDKILVPLDGSTFAEQVLPYARLFGIALSCRLELLRVFESVPQEWADPVQGRYIDQLASSFRDQAMGYLEEVAIRLRQDGLTVTCSTYEGNPAEHINSEASKEPDTLVAMSTHGRSGITRWVMGSVTDKVLHATTNPLLIVRSQEGTQASEIELRSIIVPLDGSPLSEEVLPHIGPLAKAFGAEVTLVRATDIPYNVMMDYPASMYDDLIQEPTSEAEEYLRHMVQKLSIEGVSHTRERVVRGEPAGAILDIAADTPSSLVAMSTHGHSGAGRWVLGSVTDRVVRHSSGPVLVIRTQT